MKKFVFRFEKILEMRIDKENEIKNKLAKVNQKIIEKQDQLSQAEQQNLDFLKSIESAMNEGIFASDLQAITHNKAYMKQLIQRLKSELSLFYEERRRIQQELIEANKQRKVMEKLREKELQQYKEMEAQEEAKVVDQIVTYQSTMTRGDNNG